MKIVIFFISLSFTYSLVQEGTVSESFKVFIFGCIERRTVELATQVLLATKVSSEKALELQLTCETCHMMIFSKFGSFACAFQGTIFDILLNILKSFTRF